MDALSQSEKSLFKKLSNPLKIQDFLDSLPINFEENGDTHLSPRNVLRAHKAHCIEGALLAAAILWYHGGRPLLMDFTTKSYDEDHVVALFNHQGYWGAISKTNHPILRWRDPIYKTPRELAMSYVHEYFMFESGTKTLVSYSSPVSLRRYGKAWITSDEDLFWVDDVLDTTLHHPVIPPTSRSLVRPAERWVRSALAQKEWGS
jgi:hypothetical protein